MMKKLAEDEQSRVKLCEKELGEDGLKLKAEQLKEACVLNEVSFQPVILVKLCVYIYIYRTDHNSTLLLHII